MTTGAPPRRWSRHGVVLSRRRRTQTQGAFSTSVLTMVVEFSTVNLGLWDTAECNKRCSWSCFM